MISVNPRIWFFNWIYQHLGNIHIADMEIRMSVLAWLVLNSTCVLPHNLTGYITPSFFQTCCQEMFLKMRLRNSLAKWGYGIDDVEILFDSLRHF